MFLPQVRVLHLPLEIKILINEYVEEYKRLRREKFEVCKIWMQIILRPPLDFSPRCRKWQLICRSRDKCDLYISVPLWGEWSLYNKNIKR